MNNHLHIAFATDDKYVMYTGIAMYSLFDNNKEFKNITVHILDNGVSEQSRKQLGNIANLFLREIIFYDCSEIGKWLGNDIIEMFNKENTNVPISSYARLFLPKLLNKNLNKILYLDADSIITGNYMELWNLDNSQYSVMGVIDNVTKKAKEKVGLPIEYQYINAGVMLINLKLMREMNFTNLAKQFILKYNGYVYHHDQGIINGVLHETIGYLPPQYNMMSFMFETSNIVDVKKRYFLHEFYSDDQLKYAAKHPVFIHFTEGNFQRPWVIGCKHPMRDIWETYKEKTVWRNVEMIKDTRSVKLKLLAWMRLNLPLGVMGFILKVLENKSNE